MAEAAAAEAAAAAAAVEVVEAAAAYEAAAAAEAAAEAAEAAAEAAAVDAVGTARLDTTRHVIDTHSTPSLFQLKSASYHAASNICQAHCPVPTTS